MKVVTRAELMAMPAGTLYHEWQPCCFGNLCIKGDTILHGIKPNQFPNDWWEVPIPRLLDDDEPSPFDALDKLNDGASVAIDLECPSREALYDNTLRYAVWSREDVQALYDKLASILLRQPRQPEVDDALPHVGE